MSQNYEFKFYNPQPMLTAERVASVLHGFEVRGAKIINYVLNYQVRRVMPGQTFEPSLAVAPDGTCLVGLSLPSPIGRLQVTFQTYPRESKDAQATISIGEDVLEEAPDTIAPLLVELGKIANLHLSAYFGWGDHELTLQRLESALRFDRVGALAWANLFGPEMVQRVGLEKLQILPAYHTQTFKQGVLCLLTPAPGLPLSREQIAKIRSQWPECALPIW